MNGLRLIPPRRRVRRERGRRPIRGPVVWGPGAGQVVTVPAACRPAGCPCRPCTGCTSGSLPDTLYATFSGWTNGGFTCLNGNTYPLTFDQNGGAVDGLGSGPTWYSAPVDASACPVVPPRTYRLHFTCTGNFTSTCSGTVGGFYFRVDVIAGSGAGGYFDNSVPGGPCGSSFNRTFPAADWQSRSSALALCANMAAGGFGPGDVAVSA